MIPRAPYNRAVSVLEQKDRTSKTGKEDKLRGFWEVWLSGKHFRSLANPFTILLMRRHARFGQIRSSQSAPQVAEKQRTYQFELRTAESDDTPGRGRSKGEHEEGHALANLFRPSGKFHDPHVTPNRLSQTTGSRSPIETLGSSSDPSTQRVLSPSCESRFDGGPGLKPVI